MKKFMFICIALFIGTIAIIIPFKNTAKQQEIRNNETKTYQYKLADYNGYIALFSTNKTEPVEIYKILTDSLPSSDKKSLENGIYAETAEELALILEDFTS